MSRLARSSSRSNESRVSRKAPWGWPGDPTLHVQKEGQERGFLSVPGQACSLRGSCLSGVSEERWQGRGPETVQRSLSRPQGGLGSKRAGPGSGTARPCPWEVE